MTRPAWHLDRHKNRLQSQRHGMASRNVEGKDVVHRASQEWVSQKDFKHMRSLAGDLRSADSFWKVAA